jgi:hypothetical protein
MKKLSEEKLDSILGKYFSDFDYSKFNFNKTKITETSKNYLGVNSMTIKLKKARLAVVIVIIVTLSMVFGMGTVYALEKNNIIEINTVSKDPLSGYDVTVSVSNGSLNVFKDVNGKMGVVDKSGEIILEPKWNDMVVLNENRFCVSKTDNSSNLKYGIVDAGGAVICSFNYDRIDFDSNNTIGIALKNNKFVLMNSDGKLLNKSEWDSVQQCDRTRFVGDKGVSNYKIDIIDGKITETLMYEKAKILGYDLKIAAQESGEVLDKATFDKLNVKSIEVVVAFFKGNMLQLKELCTTEYYASIVNKTDRSHSWFNHGFEFIQDTKSAKVSDKFYSFTTVGNSYVSRIETEIEYKMQKDGSFLVDNISI